MWKRLITIILTATTSQNTLFDWPCCATSLLSHDASLSQVRGSSAEPGDPRCCCELIEWKGQGGPWMDGWMNSTGLSLDSQSQPYYRRANMKQASCVTGQQHGWFHTMERCNARCHTLQLHPHIIYYSEVDEGMSIIYKNLVRGKNK